MKILRAFLAALCLFGGAAHAQEVVDLATRPGVTERMLVLAAPEAKATVLLLTGGNGHVNIRGDGQIARGDNFLVRSRELFVRQGLNVVLLDAPSDRPAPVYLGNGFRDSAEHMLDLGTAVEWAHHKFGKPVFLVGTSRGTQSAAHAGEVLTGPAGPQGIVLTSTILSRSRAGGEGRAVPEMDLAHIEVPVLVVHHQADPCPLCSPALLPQLMQKFAPGRAQLKTYAGGDSQGPACKAWSHHGFNGIEERVVSDIAAWIREHA